MRIRNLFVPYLFVLGLAVVLAGGAIRAEDHAKGGGGSRPPAPETLPNEIVAFLKTHVNSSEPYLKSLFRITPTLSMGLAAALEKAIQGGDEDPVGAIISEFMGQLTETQVKAIMDAPTEAPARSCGEKEAGNAQRLGALVQRMKWAARKVLGIVDNLPRPLCRTPEDHFIASFNKFWGETLKYNAKVNALKTKALAGDTKALAELKELVDPGALPAFLQQQSQVNSPEADRRVADFGKLFFEKLNDRYFANLNHGAGGPNARVDFGGDPAKFAAGIRELAADPNFGSLGQFALAPAAPQNPRAVSPRATGGPGAQPLPVPPPPVATGTGGSATGSPAGTGTGTSTGTGTGGTGTGGGGGGADAARAAAILSAKCGPCHKPGGSQYKSANEQKFRISNDGQLVDKNGAPLAAGSALRAWSIQEAFTRAVTQGNMPDEGLPADEKSALGAWLRSQGAN